MLDSVQLNFDGSFETFSPTDGEALTKPIRHKNTMLNVDDNVWSIYHHRNYDPKATTGPTAYDIAKWRTLG